MTLKESVVTASIITLFALSIWNIFVVADLKQATKRLIELELSLGNSLIALQENVQTVQSAVIQQQNLQQNLQQDYICFTNVVKVRK